jgi:glycosyltransferase involved in cell wall biosynthesis
LSNKIYKSKKLCNTNPLKLIFIGKEPIRKGLDRLLIAINEAQNMGAFINIRIIGCNKNDINLNDDKLPKNIEWLGFVDKSENSNEYFNLISECDIGCLLSKAEAGGICLREFHALGLAVIYSIVGGSPEHVIKNASIGIPLDMSEKEIANILFYYFINREEVNKLKNIAFNNSENMLWSYTVKKIKNII